MGVSCHFLLQGIFPTQGSKPHPLCFLYWQADSLPLRHLGSPSSCLNLYISIQTLGVHTQVIYYYFFFSNGLLVLNSAEATRRQHSVRVNFLKTELFASLMRSKIMDTAQFRIIHFPLENRKAIGCTSGLSVVLHNITL